MLDITAETKKVREDMEKQGYVLTEEEYQIILEYTIRKSDRCGKGRDYVPLLLEDEIKNYYFRNTVTAISLINMAVHNILQCSEYVDQVGNEAWRSGSDPVGSKSSGRVPE